MKFKIQSAAVVIAALLCLVLLGACGSEAASLSPTPTPEPVLNVEYRLGETVLASTEVSYGSPAPDSPDLPEGLILIAWTDVSGEKVQPDIITEDTVYYALARPVLNTGAAYLFPDENGLLRPESFITYSETAAAVRALVPEEYLPEELLSAWDASPEEALFKDELLNVLETIFDPETADTIFPTLPDSENTAATRSEFAYCIAHLSETGAIADDAYFPDVSPNHWAYTELLSAAGNSSTLTRQAVVDASEDRFVWFDGYLYCLGDDGYFITDTEKDGLYFDKNGRYTSGNAELDGYVAATICEFTSAENERIDNLKEIYNHVKNDFSYLKRNYYDSGETGWDINEAITIFSTGKGNCYCYAGAFCYLARGLGYNARTWSGTIGTEDQPHAWTEITLDGEVYICDPEIEMNYWMLEIYTDNFMLPIEDASGWVYQAVGRE